MAKQNYTSETKLDTIHKILLHRCDDTTLAQAYRYKGVTFQQGGRHYQITSVYRDDMYRLIGISEQVEK